MTRRHPCHSLLWLALLTLLWNPLGGGSYIWCMTAQGTHLESLLESHCAIGGSDETVLAAGGEGLCTESGGDLCIDHSVSREVLKSPQRQLRYKSFPVTPLFFLLSRSSALSGCGSVPPPLLPSSWQPFHPVASQRILRTTVLRC